MTNAHIPMNTSHIQDADIRQQALDISSSFIVQAPAGSGKTELLTQRYLTLLAHAEKAPEEIIAITFTRKAASEMRARIIKALEFSQTPEPDPQDYRHQTWSLGKKVLQRDQQLNWMILENPNRLRILTIDALAALLCKQTPFQAGLGGVFSPSEESAILYTQAARRTIESALATSNYQPFIEQLLLHLNNDTEKLQTLFSTFLNERDQWLPTIFYCREQHHSLRDTLENNLTRLQRELLRSVVHATPEEIKQTLVLCLHNADNCSEKYPDFVWSEKPELNQLTAWKNIAELILTKDNTIRQKIDKNLGFSANNSHKALMLSVLKKLETSQDFIAALTNIKSCPPAQYTEKQWQIIFALTQILPLLAAELTLVFQEKKQIDFTEVNLSALNALGTSDEPTDLALHLDYQIRHLLIDEFQDTSTTHLHLIEKIIAEWQPGDGRTLFVVGDPMQSIYRFRKAEVGLFLRAQQQGIGSITLTPLTLVSNFRSQGQLVNWFNHTFEQIFPTCIDINTGRVPYTPAVAVKENLSMDAYFYPHIKDQNTEAKTLVEKIQAIQANNSADTIAILVRTRNKLVPIIAELQAKKLAYQAVEIEPLEKRPEIRDLISLTSAMLHRADRVAWFAVLRSPLCGLLLADLDILSNAHPHYTVWESVLAYEDITDLSEDAKIRLHHFRYFLTHAFNLQATLRLSAWIEGTWLALRGPQTLSSPSSLAYTRTFFDLLEKFDRNEPVTTDILKSRCEKLFANAKPSTENPIQLMTIHKSKGLEFDHVFLPALESQVKSDDSKLFLFCDRPSIFGGDDLLMAPIPSSETSSDPTYQYLKALETEKQDCEMTRLFYVAATRAKKSLHLSFSFEWDDQKNCAKITENSGFLKLLEKIVEPYVAVKPQHIAVSENSDDTPISIFERLPTETTLPESNVDFLPTANITLALENNETQLIGTAVHEALQWIATYKNVVFNAAQWAVRLHTLGMPMHLVSTHIKTVEKAVLNTLADEKGKWILSDHHDAHNEWAFSRVIEDKVEHKIMDRAFVDENNIRWIIDYKTALPHEDESMDVFLERQKKLYQPQLETYAALLAARENRTIKMALYFPLCQGFVSWS